MKPDSPYVTLRSSANSIPVVDILSGIGLARRAEDRLAIGQNKEQRRTRHDVVRTLAVIWRYLHLQPVAEIVLDREIDAGGELRLHGRELREVVRVEILDDLLVEVADAVAALAMIDRRP